MSQIQTKAQTAPDTRDREEIPDRYKWDLQDIYADWEAWNEEFERCEALMDEFLELKGTLSEGPQRVLEAYRLNDRVGMIAYKLYRYPQLAYDVDQRNNEIQAKLQRVQILFAEFGTKTAWFDPEIVDIPEEKMVRWIDETEELEEYRFPIAEIYRSQEHLLDESGETLLSYQSRFNSMPAEAYRALSTADVDFRTIELSDGTETRVTPGEYSRILRTQRDHEDRRKAFEAMYEVFADNRNTYAALYAGICQRDWAKAQSRDFETTAEAALFGNDVPVTVLENLISSAKAGTAPLRRYHELRAEVLELDAYDLYDSSVPLMEFDKEYPYGDVTDLIIESVAPLGTDYQSQLEEALRGGWIDVYENEGKRSGAYSAGVYGVHPYILLNYNDTLDNVFTLAHELGHTMHTRLSNETQPFATSSYTIFVAEVASTLNEALLLDLLLEKTDDPTERAVLLQHAIDGICGTFYTQSLFADYELQAHRLAEQGHPITAEELSGIYYGLLEEYYGDAIARDRLYEVTWARIPHFFNSPYYVYQYATCYASSAQIVQHVLSDDAGERQEAVDRYLTLLRAGGSDHPMELLREAGVDLSKPDAIDAVIEQFDDMVDMLETELRELA